MERARRDLLAAALAAQADAAQLALRRCRAARHEAEAALADLDRSDSGPPDLAFAAAGAARWQAWRMARRAELNAALARARVAEAEALARAQRHVGRQQAARRALGAGDGGA